MIVEGQHPNHHGTKPSGEAFIHPTGTFRFLVLGQYQFYGNRTQPIQQTLKETNLRREHFESIKGMSTTRGRAENGGLIEKGKIDDEKIHGNVQSTYS